MEQRDGAGDGTEDEGALAPLRQLAPRLVDVLEATTRRADVRATRARLLRVLLRARCPLDGVRQRPWYVPGAVARLGARGLARAWCATFPSVEPPSARRLRGHLAALERDLLLVRAPGDWLPRLGGTGGALRRYRWPDTFHVLESDAAAEFWATTGAGILAAHPEARTNPTAWRAHFADWRGRRPVQRELFAELARKLDVARPAVGASLVDLRHAEQLRRVAIAPASARPAELLAGLEAAGCALRGKNRELATRQPERLRGAAAVLCGVLRRGRPVKNGSGFLVAVWRRAPAEELAAALEQLRSA